MLVDSKYIELSVVKQCELLEVNRSSFYYEPVAESEENLSIMRVLDEQYFKTPFYGLERLLVLFILKGYKINRKRLRRLMKIQGWKTLYCKPRTTRIDPTAYKYPYLLRGLAIERSNQVWEIDITYLPMKNGFMYFFHDGQLVCVKLQNENEVFHLLFNNQIIKLDCATGICYIMNFTKNFIQVFSVDDSYLNKKDFIFNYFFSKLF